MSNIYIKKNWNKSKFSWCLHVMIVWLPSPFAAWLELESKLRFYNLIHEVKLGDLLQSCVVKGRCICPFFVSSLIFIWFDLITFDFSFILIKRLRKIPSRYKNCVEAELKSSLVSSLRNDSTIVPMETILIK